MVAHRSPRTARRTPLTAHGSPRTRFRRTLRVVGCLAFALPPASRAQIPDRPAGVPATASVRGEVFDSLIGAPLEGARVHVQGTRLSATTDRRGRFALESVPAGRRVLVLDHPALDSVGLSDLPWVVDVSDTGATQVALAVPSLHRFAAGTCALPASGMGPDSGIVFGAVRDAERGVRLSGARVVASWVAVDRARRRSPVGRHGRDVVTDSLGNYYLCGVPSAVGIAVQTSAGAFASGEVQLELGARRLLRRDLSVSREPPAAESDTAAGTRKGHATLVGTVRGDRGFPVERALASVVGTPGEIASDRDGRFLLADLPSGSQMLLVRRIGYGYSATPVDLRNRDTTRVALTLSAVTLLDTVQVTTTEWVRAEIDELRTRLRFGTSNRVMTADDLARLGTIHVALQEFPGMSVARISERARRGGPGVVMRYGGTACAPDVYIDGLKRDLDQLEFYRPTDLIALEVYRPSEVPQRYINPWRGCGVVLAWTRYLQ